MLEKYCCNCGAKDGETAKERAKRQGSFDWQQQMEVRFSVLQVRFDYLCQFCNLLPEHRHLYSETTGDALTQV